MLEAILDQGQGDYVVHLQADGPKGSLPQWERDAERGRVING